MSAREVEEAGWTTVETCVRGKIAVEVRQRTNHDIHSPPLYSVRIGRARMAPDATVWISPHMSIYDLRTAEELLVEIGEKYRLLRADAQPLRVVEHRRARNDNLVPYHGRAPVEED